MGTSLLPSLLHKFYSNRLGFYPVVRNSLSFWSSQSYCRRRSASVSYASLTGKHWLRFDSSHVPCRPLCCEKFKNQAYITEGCLENKFLLHSTKASLQNKNLSAVSSSGNADNVNEQLLHTRHKEHLQRLSSISNISLDKDSKLFFCKNMLFHTVNVHSCVHQEKSRRVLSGKRYLYTLPPFLLQPFMCTITRQLEQRLHTLEHFNVDNVSYNEYLESLVLEHTALSEAQLKGESIDHYRLMFLESVSTTVKELHSQSSDLIELQKILSGEEDKELKHLAKADVDDTQKHIEDLQWKLVDLLVGEEPADKNDVMLEVSAGVGGQEAMLFTAEIFDMYASYAGFRGWSFSIVNHENSDIGGLRKASVLISGLDVYKHLKYEGGVHRVQRVPKTEKSGRVHTSTMTVAVLPQPSQIDISVNPKDLQIDTFRSAGAGGQHVNTTDSAVRITHKPTGTVAECQQERSQIKNKDIAMKVLLSRLYQKQLENQEAAYRKNRKLQIGSAGRSEKIRTYNYSQDRVTDHRGPITFYGLSLFLSGEESMEELIESLILQSRLEILQSMVDEYMDSKQKKK